MAVSLVPKFNRQQIAKVIQQRKGDIEAAILLRLQRIGEQFVTNARNSASFTDRTGNLRSSIAYVILKDGVQIDSNFEERKGGRDGVSAARDVISAAKKNFPTGFVLIGVAGMSYSAAVEANGFSVITPAANEAQRALIAAVKRIGDKLK